MKFRSKEDSVEIICLLDDHFLSIFNFIPIQNGFFHPVLFHYSLPTIKL